MFSEFGYVMAVAILISGMVSLTLTPMLCARLIKEHQEEKRPGLLLRLFEASFKLVDQGLFPHGALGGQFAGLHARRHGQRPSSVTAILFLNIPKGFFPQEDMGFVSVSTVGPDDVSFEAMMARQQAPSSPNCARIPASSPSCRASAAGRPTRSAPAP